MNLPAEMLRAADALAELNRRYDFAEHMSWDPESLRREARVVEAEDRETEVLSW